MMTTPHVWQFDPHPPYPSRVDRAMLEGVERDVQLAYRIGGMFAVLGTLNARTRFRLTALCPFEPVALSSVFMYDRDRPRGHRDESIGEICSAARSVARDHRALPDDVAIVPDAFSSRAGALVLTADGAQWGVLFHYDLRLRVAAPNERVILEHLGRRLAFLFPSDLTT